MEDFLVLHGVKVPAADYSRVERLANIVFGYTCTLRSNERQGRKISVKIAMDLHAEIQRRVYWMEVR